MKKASNQPVSKLHALLRVSTPRSTHWWTETKPCSIRKSIEFTNSLYSSFEKAVTGFRNSKFERCFLAFLSRSTGANERFIMLIEELMKSTSRFISSFLILVLGKVRNWKDTKSERSLCSCPLCAGMSENTLDESEGLGAPIRFILDSKSI